VQTPWTTHLRPNSISVICKSIIYQLIRIHIPIALFTGNATDASCAATVGVVHWVSVHAHKFRLWVSVGQVVRVRHNRILFYLVTCNWLLNCITIQIIQLGCIECMRCRVLLPMIAVSVCLSVCLSRGSTRLYCAKMAERIKMLSGVNTPGSPWNIMLDGGPDLPTERSHVTYFWILGPSSYLRNGWSYRLEILHASRWQ